MSWWKNFGVSHRSGLIPSQISWLKYINYILFIILVDSEPPTLLNKSYQDFIIKQFDFFFKLSQN